MTSFFYFTQPPTSTSTPYLSSSHTLAFLSCPIFRNCLLSENWWHTLSTGTRVWHSWKCWHKWISEYIHFNSPIVNRSPDLSPTCIRVFFLLSHFVYNWQSWVLCPFPHLPPHFLARRHHIMEILCNCNFEQGLRFSGGNWRKNFSENNLDICEGIIFYQHQKRYFGLFFSVYLKKKN